VLRGSLGIEQSSSASQAAQRRQRAGAAAQKRHSRAKRPLGCVRGQGSLTACARDATATAASAGAESNGMGCCRDGNPAASRACTAREFLWEKTLIGGAALRQQSLTGGPKRYRGPQGRDTERERAGAERVHDADRVGWSGSGLFDRKIRLFGATFMLTTWIGSRRVLN
jgi:hypothetical protein